MIIAVMQKGEQMRLIDADAFERAVMFSDDEDLQDVIYRLRDFPTIEPERKNIIEIPEGYSDTFGDGVDWILEKMPKVTEEAVKEYCRKRRLCIIDSALLKKYASAQQELIRCKDCKHYYFAENRVPEEQSWVCDVWHVNQTAHMGYCFKAERRTDAAV